METIRNVAMANGFKETTIAASIGTYTNRESNNHDAFRHK